MQKLIRLAAILIVLGAAAFWFVTRPGSVPSDYFVGLEPDATAGQLVFVAGGCASCHAAPGSKDEDRLILTGGAAFASPFGTFYAPNISSDPVAGIGAWSDIDLANALIHGASPDGQHYYPALPYASYRLMAAQDALNLSAYLHQLPADATPSRAHDVGFPFNIRRSLGGWKLLFLSDSYVMDAATPELERGRYLVEALGHCAECHTPRNALGGLDRSRWMQGAPHPSGKGNVPPLVPGALNWNRADIVAFLQSGLTPEFDSAGAEMGEVIENMKQLPVADQEAIADYLLALP